MTEQIWDSEKKLHGADEDPLRHTDHMAELYSAGLAEEKPMISSMVQRFGEPTELERLKTRCRHLETALQQSEERFYKLFHASSNMMILATLKEGRILDLNEAVTSTCGYAREELIGHRPEDHGLFADPQQMSSLIRELKEKGSVHDLEVKLVTKSGAIRTTLLSADPIFVNDEPSLFMVSVDATASEEATQVLRESEKEHRDSREFLDHILNCIGDSIFVKNLEHKFVLCNSAFCSFTGRSREEVLGQKGYEFACQETAKLLKERDENVFKTGKEIADEVTIPDSQGNLHALLIKTSLLTDPGGRKQIVSICRDITAYKQLQAQFMQAQKMEAIGVLAGGIAHDFNNLLTVIKGYAEMMAQDFDPADPRRRDLEQIQNAGQQGASLISQLLAFSRKQILQPEVLNLNETVEKMGKMLRRVIGEDIRLEISTRPELGLINADPSQIHQIVMNLATNARDAMPQGGNLTIETANVDFDEDFVREHPVVKAGRCVMLAISDNGIGMDAATRSHLFEPFFTTKKLGKGTGLGLSTVYGIVKQNGGFIWVYSEPGKGTTFKVYFPRAESAHVALLGKKPDPEYRGSESVLVVEDDDAVRTLACRILRNRGYTIHEAANGADALRIARDGSKKIHLVLTDTVMPGMSGKEMVSKILGFRPGIKSLYVSGYTDDTIVHHGILQSGVDFLQKPFTAQGLARKVREVINS